MRRRRRRRRRVRSRMLWVKKRIYCILYWYIHHRVQLK
jgi:hypothetical protein